MDKTLYDLMDWAGIEEIVYSEAANPHRMLGAHMTPEGMLVQAFIPTARDITVKLSATGKQYHMEMADETIFRPEAISPGVPSRNWMRCSMNSAPEKSASTSRARTLRNTIRKIRPKRTTTLQVPEMPQNPRRARAARKASISRTRS